MSKLIRSLPYDMKKPYKLIVSQTGNVLIQNGIVYEYGTGRALGPVAALLKDPKPGLVYCNVTAASYPDTVEGRAALKEYQERKGILKKEEPQIVKESSLEERKAEVAKKRAEIEKSKGKSSSLHK